VLKTKAGHPTTVVLKTKAGHPTKKLKAGIFKHVLDHSAYFERWEFSLYDSTDNG